MVGMRDVAKKAGVSLSTVSLVVNGNGYVSDDMRERVRKAMQALNYVPNELARNLYHDRTNLVGVIVRGCGCFFGRSGGQSKTSAVLHGAHPVQ